MEMQNMSLTFAERHALKRAIKKSVPERKVHKRLVRLGLMSQEVSGKPGYMPTPTGKVQTSENGIDYLAYYKKERHDLWLKNMWIPIIVSFATTVTVNYILPKLPLMLKWMGRILS